MQYLLTNFGPSKCAHIKDVLISWADLCIKAFEVAYIHTRDGQLTGFAY